jgi:esterase
MDDGAAADAAADRTRQPRAVGQYSYDGDVFFIHRGASCFVRHSHIATVASYFPNHMLTTIRGVGHWVHAEAPDDTIALLKQYLDR